METKKAQSCETNSTDNIDIIAAIIYKAISNKMLSQQNEECEDL